jgi:hypothetical protein
LLGLPSLNEAIFQFLQINKSQDYEILKADTVRTLNHQEGPNPRGRHRKIEPEKAYEIVDLMRAEPRDAQRLSWQQLAAEAGIEATEKTVQFTLEDYGIVTAKAAQKPRVSEPIAKKRVERAQAGLEESLV